MSRAVTIRPPRCNGSRPQLGLPRGLRDIGLREDQIAEAARLIEPAVPADNPVPAGARGAGGAAAPGLGREIRAAG